MATYTLSYTGAETDENLGFALNGAAKAWVSFDGTATTPTPLNDYNCSSITDDGAGDYEANWTNPFTTTCAELGFWATVRNNPDTIWVSTSGSSTAKLGIGVGPVGATVDREVSCGVHGDLA